MTTPAPDSNEPSKLNKIMNSPHDESIMSRLPPRRNGVRSATPQTTPPEQALPAPTPAPIAQPKAEKEPRWRWKFLPAFWTIASVITFTVNIILLIAVFLLLQNREPVGALANDQVGQLLGGLYNNFVLMDEANIRTNIHVEKEIPVQFSLNVSGPTDVTLRQAVTIDGALVTVTTGGLNIVNARARIVLPEGTVLPVNIQNLVVPVDQKVLAVLDVPVDIPLNQTELHEPFVGLQKVVEPWYCLMEPNALVNGGRVCDQVKNPLAPLLDIVTP